MAIHWVLLAFDLVAWLVVVGIVLAGAKRQRLAPRSRAYLLRVLPIVVGLVGLGLFLTDLSTATMTSALSWWAGLNLGIVIGVIVPLLFIYTLPRRRQRGWTTDARQDSGQSSAS